MTTPATQTKAPQRPVSDWRSPSRPIRSSFRIVADSAEVFGKPERRPDWSFKPENRLDNKLRIHRKEGAEPKTRTKGKCRAKTVLDAKPPVFANAPKVALKAALAKLLKGTK